jgi:hypothetical protein
MLSVTGTPRQGGVPLLIGAANCQPHQGLLDTMFGFLNGRCDARHQENDVEFNEA